MKNTKQYKRKKNRDRNIQSAYELNWQQKQIPVSMPASQPAQNRSAHKMKHRKQHSSHTLSIAAVANKTILNTIFENETINNSIWNGFGLCAKYQARVIA